jgi:UDP-3-O-[3-hydroxymyristoyl] N-acetylglucosamine deacetylase
MRLQTTIASSISSDGVGLHSGEPSRLWLHPAPAGTGIVFHHRQSGQRIPAQVDHAHELSYATRLGLADATISTVEHLLSALRGLRIDNVIVEIDGNEVPILDGSAAPFVELIDRAGVTSQDRPATALRISRTIEVREGEKWLRIEPAETFSVDYRISFDNPLVGFQRYVGVITPETYRQAIAPARTFGFLKDVRYLKSRGLARGGSLSNCVVVDEERIVSGELRFPDEFVRHKVLDLIGDLALLEYPLEGAVTGYKAGHALHADLVRAILSNPERWELVGFDSRTAFVAPYPMDLGVRTALAV